MKKLFIIALLAFAGSLFASALPADRLQVSRKGNDILIKSEYSPEYFLLQKISLGTRNYQINFVSTSLQDKKTGKVIIVHSCPDDATPLNLNSTYIGANHGCSDADTVILKDHGFTEKDLGKVINKGKADGGKFYIVSIIDKDRFGTLSEPYKNPRRPWSFGRIGRRGVADLKLFFEGKELKGAKYAGIFQYQPCLRFHYQKYIVDGRELKDGETVICKNFRIEESYDILRPESMLAKQKENVGRKLDLKDPSIAAVVLVRIAYDFAPGGVCIIDNYCKALCDFYLSIHGVIQSMCPNSRALDRKGAHFYYIPKTIPFKNKYKVKVGAKMVEKEYSFNFLKGENFFTFPWPSVSFSEKNKNIADVNNPPDSAIQFLGKYDKNGKFVPVFGYALGYSMTEGDTVPAIRSKQAQSFWWVHSTRKTYPSAAGNINNVKAGKEFHTYAYRQYFDAAPRKDISGTVYYHKLKGAWYIYLDYQKSVKDEFVKLPDCVKGMKLSVVEQTPSVSFKEAKGGILLNVKDGYGRLVLKAK